MVALCVLYTCLFWMCVMTGLVVAFHWSPVWIPITGAISAFVATFALALCQAAGAPIPTDCQDRKEPR